MKRNLLLILILVLGCFGGSLKANDKANIGIVNFGSCVMESKYGKYEQNQFEKIRSQWTSLIEDTEKELKEISAKFEDQEYLDGLSPEAEDEMKAKYRSLYEDMGKYQNQLNQVLSQANYFFIQRMSANISKASESIAKNKKINFIINKDACFYYANNLDLTKDVIHEMNKNYEQDVKEKKISENIDENAPQISAEEGPTSEPEAEKVE